MSTMKNEILNVADMLATADAAGLDFAAAKKARSSALSAAVRFLCDARPRWSADERASEASEVLAAVRGGNTSPKAVLAAVDAAIASRPI